METGDWAHTSMMYWHYIRCLLREVLVQILEQTLANIEGVNVETFLDSKETWASIAKSNSTGLN